MTVAYFDFAPGAWLQLDGTVGALVRVVARMSRGERGDEHNYLVAWTYAGAYSETWVEAWRLETYPLPEPEPAQPASPPSLDDIIPF